MNVDATWQHSCFDEDHFPVSIKETPSRPYERFAAVTYEVSHGFLEGLESLMEETKSPSFIKTSLDEDGERL
jgi:hypothetical protein